jgi:hypothetical protein
MPCLGSVTMRLGACAAPGAGAGVAAGVGSGAPESVAARSCARAAPLVSSNPSASA